MQGDREIFMRWIKTLMTTSGAVERVREGMNLDTGEPELFVTTHEGREFILDIREM